MLHQVTRVMPGVSSAKSSAWLAVPADRPARGDSAMGRYAAGPRPHVAMLNANGNLSGSDAIRLARLWRAMPPFPSSPTPSISLEGGYRPQNQHQRRPSGG